MGPRPNSRTHKHVLVLGQICISGQEIFHHLLRDITVAKLPIVLSREKLEDEVRAQDAEMVE